MHSCMLIGFLLSPIGGLDLMLIRFAGLLRLLGYLFEIVTWCCQVGAQLIEEIGIESDADTFLWVLFLFLIITRRFKWLFFGLVLLGLSSILVRTRPPAADHEGGW